MANNKPICIGDKISVYGYPPAKVIDIILDSESKFIRLILDWGEFGVSKVWLHDEGEIWFRYSESN